MQEIIKSQPLFVLGEPGYYEGLRHEPKALNLLVGSRGFERSLLKPSGNHAAFHGITNSQSIPTD